MVRLHLHAAELSRSFAKVGIMDPYVVVSVDDGKEAYRTAPARWAHKRPQWESECTIRAVMVPSSITLAVWNANRMRRDVFCGSVTIPCSIDMCLLDKEFALTKRGEQTGTVRLSLQMLGVQPPPGLPREDSTTTIQSALGAELDHMGSWLDHKSPLGTAKAGPMTLSLAEPEGKQAMLEGETSPLARTLLENRSRIHPELKPEDAELIGAEQRPCSPKSPKVASPAAPAKIEDEIAEVLRGAWTCVATTGLEEFLKHTGIGAFQRKLAMAARWPSWEFKVTEGNIHFLNHSAMGDLHEDIRWDGQPYQWRDGRGNLMSCTATWEKTADGGILRVSRTGTIATYSEERRVEGDTLTFSLTNADGATWGRIFNRA